MIYILVILNLHSLLSLTIDMSLIKYFAYLALF